jgi:hypothetical protein
MKTLSSRIQYVRVSRIIVRRETEPNPPVVRLINLGRKTLSFRAGRMSMVVMTL